MKRRRLSKRSRNLKIVVESQSFAAVQTLNSQISEDVKENDIVGLVHGRVLQVPDAHGKGEVVQRDGLFVRTSLSHIKLRKVEGGVLIYYH